MAGKQRSKDLPETTRPPSIGRLHFKLVTFCNRRNEIQVKFHRDEVKKMGFLFIRIRCLLYYVRGPMRQYVTNCFISKGTVKESFATGQAENWIQLFQMANNRGFYRLLSILFVTSFFLLHHTTNNLFISYPYTIYFVNEYNISITTSFE